MAPQVFEALLTASAESSSCGVQTAVPRRPTTTPAAAVARRAAAPAGAPDTQAGRAPGGPAGHQSQRPRGHHRVAGAGDVEHFPGPPRPNRLEALRLVPVTHPHAGAAAGDDQ